MQAKCLQVSWDSPRSRTHGFLSRKEMTPTSEAGWGWFGGEADTAERRQRSHRETRRLSAVLSSAAGHRAGHHPGAVKGEPGTDERKHGAPGGGLSWQSQLPKVA